MKIVSEDAEEDDGDGFTLLFYVDYYENVDVDYYEEEGTEHSH